MRAMRAEGFSGYNDLKPVDIPKPAVSWTSTGKNHGGQAYRGKDVPAG
jgi:hypothetical protein